MVRDASGNLDPVFTDTSIRFKNATTFQPCTDYVMIPKYKFEFMDLGDLMNEDKKYGPEENPEFAIDIIGVVEDFIKVSKTPTKFGDIDIVRFKICDASNKHKVGIWGDMAKVVSDQYEEYNHEENVIVILTSAKLGTYNDTLQISSLTSSKVYFNLDDECVLEMRNKYILINFYSFSILSQDCKSYVHHIMGRLELKGYKPSRDDVDNSYALTLTSPYEFINLKKLIDNVAGSIEKKLYYAFTIAKLEKGHPWFSYSCSKCHLEVVEVGNRFKCEKVEVAAKVFPTFLHDLDGKEIIDVVEVHTTKDILENFIIKSQDMYDTNIHWIGLRVQRPQDLANPPERG
ncbi:uncharacterized protein LOC141715117 [Apium graveolens]|uniref:uncharacterized protein LOC141715117 n=1 Tax=Apium graveolens TaxID=4045 RepID=UPI003D796F5A